MANKFFLRAALLVGVLSCLSQNTKALRCYECTNSKACNDEFDPNGSGISNITQLPGNLQCEYCLKAKVETLGTQATSRACVSDRFVTYQTGCFVQYDQDEVKSTICYCEGDDCNNSNSLKVPVFLMIVSALAQMIGKRL